MCNLEAELFSNGIICRVPQTDNSFQITQKEKLISAFECSMTFFLPKERIALIISSRKGRPAGTKL